MPHARPSVLSGHRTINVGSGDRAMALRMDPPLTKLCMCLCVMGEMIHSDSVPLLERLADVWGGEAGMGWAFLSMDKT